MIQEATFIFPGQCWLYQRQPIRNQLVGWGFDTLRCGIDLGDNRFHPLFVGIPCIWKVYDPGISPNLPRVQAGSTNPDDSRSASGISVCPLCWEISTRGITVFVHGSSALPMCGRISWSRNGPLSSPGSAGSMKPNQRAIRKRGWGFDTLRCGIVLGDNRLHPQFDGVMCMWKV